MRITWGTKIFIAYTAFALGILFLAYKASQQNFDLVTENYYEAELKYQHVIDEKDRAAQLSEEPKISHTINSVTIQLPKEFAAAAVEGELYLYRPSDATKDLRRPFSAATGAIQLTFDKELSGMYDAKLSWQSGGKRFLVEKKIFF